MRHLLALSCLCLFVAEFYAADDKAGDDTPKAAATRKLLKVKISVDFKDTRLADAIEEIKEQFKEKKMNISIRLDTKGGVSQNRTLTYKADDQPLEQVFEGMFKKIGLTYTIISGKNNAYDGSILVKQK